MLSDSSDRPVNGKVTKATADRPVNGKVTKATTEASLAHGNILKQKSTNLLSLDHQDVHEKETVPSLPSLLLLNRTGDRSLHSQPPANHRVKPNIHRLPESDVMSRMKAFMPFMSSTNDVTHNTDSSSSHSAVKFVPIEESDSDSDSDGDSDSDSDSDTDGPCVEMRLALVPDNTSEDEDEDSTDNTAVGEVTSDNIKIPGSNNDNMSSPSIEELD